MNDHDIVSLYYSRDERAISEVEKKYGKYLRYVALSILRNDGEAEECVNDVYLAAWNAIPPAKPDDLRPYLGAICRRQALKRIEERTAQKRGRGREDEVFEEAEGCDFADFTDEITLKDALDRFLRGLPREACIIFVQRYWFVRSLSEIARDRRMSENAVKVCLHRTREKLKEFLKKEGYLE